MRSMPASRNIAMMVSRKLRPRNESRALSRPIRELSPAARIRAAMLGSEFNEVGRSAKAQDTISHKFLFHALRRPLHSSVGKPSEAPEARRYVAPRSSRPRRRQRSLPGSKHRYPDLPENGP